MFSDVRVNMNLFIIELALKSKSRAVCQTFWFAPLTSIKYCAPSMSFG
jgi:hypothetical protein